jgi:hypothetical protein
MEFNSEFKGLIHHNAISFDSCSNIPLSNLLPNTLNLCFFPLQNTKSQ